MNRKELKKMLFNDRKNYDCDDFLHLIYYRLISEKKYKFYSIVKTCRKCLYYNSKKNKFLYFIPKIIYLIRFNILSQQNRIYIKCKFGDNLKIWHENIVINKNVKMGNNIQLHGNNCIGNDGIDLNNCPQIGNNVEIGYGATIIGNIKIADGIIIGANSLVNKSFLEPNVIIAGNPAIIIKK